MRERIYLVGYRGTGKSTVGPLLAKKLGWLFQDADADFESRHALTIRDCFALYGESGFRDRETECLRHLSRSVHAVIATGGGIILREENRKLLRETGFIAWLEANVETIEARINADPSTNERRPNLQNGGVEEIREMLAFREPFYEEIAQIRISTDALFPEQACDAILEAWNGTPSSSKFFS